MVSPSDSSQLEAGFAQAPADEKRLFGNPEHIKVPRARRCSRAIKRTIYIIFGTLTLIWIAMSGVSFWVDLRKALLSGHGVLTENVETSCNVPCSRHSSPSHEALINEVEKLEIGESEKPVNLGRRQDAGADTSAASTPGGGNGPTSTSVVVSSTTEPATVSETVTDGTTTTSEVPDTTAANPTTSEEPTTSSPPAPTTTSEDTPTATPTEEPTTTSEPSSTEESTSAEPTSSEVVSSSAVEETITTELPGGGKKTIIATSYAEVAPSSKPTGETSDPGLQDAGPTLSRNSMLPITVALVLGYILAV